MEPTERHAPGISRRERFDRSADLGAEPFDPRRDHKLRNGTRDRRHGKGGASYPRRPPSSSAIEYHRGYSHDQARREDHWEHSANERARQRP
jgi:hypothetical protein